MKDTRLWDLLSDIESGIQITRDITDGALPADRDERRRVIEERKPFYRAADGLREAHRVVLDALGAQVCLLTSSAGSECTRQSGHSDAHRSMWGHRWTDEENAVWSRNVKAEMEGSRD